MSFALIQKVNDEQKKKQVVDARSGDTVRVHQKIKEGAKTKMVKTIISISGSQFTYSGNFCKYCGSKRQ